MKSQLIFDLTSSWNWARQPVGIIRAEIEIAKHLLANCGDAINFCIYVKELDVFLKLNKRSAEIFLLEGSKEPIVSMESNDLSVIVFSPTDWYISIGLDWDDKNLLSLYQRKKKIGFRVALFCHDVIATKFPQLCLDRVAKMFPTYLYSCAWCADVFLCNSNVTRLDLLAFLEEINSPRPSTAVVKLAPFLPDKNSRTSSKSISNLCRQRFLLYVSSIEARKNHAMLHRAYLAVAEKLTSPPLLVFVGMNGWGVENLHEQIRKSNLSSTHVVILNHVSDDDLAQLYKSCMFTVFPSYFEGWGLPISESLGHGKFCIASNTSSMPEVGGEYCDYLDPYDQRAWEMQLGKYFLRPDLISDKEEIIRDHFKPITWGDVALNLLRAINVDPVTV